MIIHVKKRDNPYAQIDKRALNDDRLSWKARGLLSYLLSKPPDWQVWVRDLVNRSQKDGETAIRSALKELKKYGYMQEHQSRMEDGTFGPVEYWVYEEPLGGFPQTDKPQAVEPKAEKPHSGNQSHTDNDSTKNQSTENEEKESPAFPEKKERTDEQETDSDHPVGHDKRSGDLDDGDGGSVEVDRDASARLAGRSVHNDHTPDPILFDLERRTAQAQADAGGNPAVPPAAGGSDGFQGGPVDAFCEVLAAIVPNQLPKKQRKSWGLKLGEIAKEWSGDDRTVTPEIMEAAIRAVPEDEFVGWRSFSSPYSDNFDKHIGPLLLSGGKPRQKGNQHGPHQAVHGDRKRRTPDQWRDPVPT